MGIMTHTSALRSSENARGVNSYVKDAGCGHMIVKTGSGPKAAKTPAFNWVNTALGNIKAWIPGFAHGSDRGWSHARHTTAPSTKTVPPGRSPQAPAAQKPAP